ncbi:MAG: DUF4843 domain-containing protein [Bacteroidales bacterium]|nr:DUF4843 domain-containing protein [Bacteroidales bacterium]
MKGKIILSLVCALCLAGCKGTWLMYDSDQTPLLYFLGANAVHTESFSLMVEDEIHLVDSVRVLGGPAKEDRPYEIEILHVAPGETFSAGNETRPLVSGQEGEDFVLGDLVIPAGKVAAPLSITLKRSAKMQDNTVCVYFRIKENAQFRPCAPDSLDSSGRVRANIFTPYYRVYVSDGEPSCPSWWKWNGDAYPLGWHPYLGIYYPDKYRRMLQYLKESEEKSPIFYATYTGNWGEHLENAPLMFWNKCFTSAWARFVAVPLYDYYWEYYQQHPDDPHKEEMTYANIPACVGWGNPSEGTYGILN